MEEKIIEASFKKNALSRTLSRISIVLTVFGLVNSFLIYATDGITYSWRGDYIPYTDLYDSFLEFILRNYDEVFPYLIYAGIVGILVALFFKWQMSNCALTVTNRRVTGKASFGKSVELPLNQISAVGLGALSRITVATSSGKLNFWFVKNREEVHNALSNIIGKVQVEAAYTQNTSAQVSSADELKKYKDLLDMGAITQEEFDAKKKQILGL